MKYIVFASFTLAIACTAPVEKVETCEDIKTHWQNVLSGKVATDNLDKTILEAHDKMTANNCS